ncbi:MAG: AMP-binding protein, partial [bacterium]|nr:AMP-binding protein [bacterium]
LLSALSHDPLHRDVFMPLAYGATICIPDPERMGTPGYLAGWFREHRLTILNAAPAMLQLVCHRPAGTPRAALDSLRHAFVIGDVLTRDDVRALYELSPTVECVNYYGSTETQRAVSYYVIARQEQATRGFPRRGTNEGFPRRGTNEGLPKAVLPLGRGIRGVQLLVLSPA